MSDRVQLFHEQRPRMYGIAYRMLGSTTEAEDMVQEAYLRWHDTDAAGVRTPQAWLTTTVTRLCIDRLRKARAEREAYVGPWLPEPLANDGNVDVATEIATDLSVAFLVVLERLAPEERAAFLLHEVFDSEYEEIAGILGKTEATCRQIVRRARERVQRDRPRFQVTKAARERLLERFLTALRAEDHASLLALFTADATWTSDGGGKTRAARKVLHGADQVVRFVSRVWRIRLHQMTHRLLLINGEMGLVIFGDEEPHSVITIDTDGERICAVFAVLNPEKLRRITPAAAQA